MTEAKRKTAGRPTTRNREAFMLAIWRIVQEEMHCRGAPSVREACQRIFNKRANGLIKFVNEDGVLIDLISGNAGVDN